MDITVFLGAPGSGKGTQAKKLASERGFHHLSTGDILRAAIQQGTDLGLKAKTFMDRGDLVPDDVMIGLIRDTFSGLPPGSRIILDGFPRTDPQARELDKSRDTSVARAIFFKVPEEDLVTRLTGRRICEKCGEPFHVKLNPPKTADRCDKCQGKLVQRSDDNENVVRKRLSVYQNQTSQLLDFYRSAGKLLELDGNVPIANLQASLNKVLH